MVPPGFYGQSGAMDTGFRLFPSQSTLSPPDAPRTLPSNTTATTSQQNNHQANNPGSAAAPTTTPAQQATSTSNEWPAMFPLGATKNATPVQGKSYMILDHTYEHALCIQNGKLLGINLATARANHWLGGCYLWHYDETNQTLGFRNDVTGEYLTAWGFVGLQLSGTVPREDGWFKLSPSSEGGYCIRRRRDGDWTEVCFRGEGGRLCGPLSSGRPLPFSRTAFGFVEVEWNGNEEGAVGR